MLTRRNPRFGQGIILSRVAIGCLSVPFGAGHRTGNMRAGARPWSAWAIRAWAILFPALFIGACASPVRQAAVPTALTEQVSVLEIPNARFWADTQGPEMVQEAMRAIDRERAVLPGAARPGTPLPEANYLALSGGSDNGAFGAGLLSGWTDNGTRPSFKLVTGISTGALIAPFAFLGPAYDQQLRTIYTGIGPQNVYERRSVLTAVFSDALADTEPLYLVTPTQTCSPRLHASTPRGACCSLARRISTSRGRFSGISVR